MLEPVGLLVMRYAFPCAEISIQLRNVTRADYDRIEQALLKGQSLPRNELERYFPALIRRLKEVAEREGLPLYWTVDAVHAYFLKYHDEYIAKGDGMLGKMSPSEKELCRCRIGRVTDVKGEIVRVETKQGAELVFSKYLPNIDKGDIIVSHRKFATERLFPGQAAMYGFP